MPHADLTLFLTPAVKLQVVSPLLQECHHKWAREFRGERWALILILTPTLARILTPALTLSQSPFPGPTPDQS